MDLVCKNGSSISKKGKFGGRKYAYRCPKCFSMDVSLSGSEEIVCACGSLMKLAEVPLMKAGKRVHSKNAADIREYVLAQLKQMGEL